MARIDWKDTQLGNSTKNIALYVGEKDDRIFLRLDSNVDNQVIQSNLQNSNKDVARFAPTMDNDVDIFMDKKAELIEERLKSVSNGSHIDTTLQSATKHLRKIEPVEITFTKADNKFFATYEMVLNR